VLRLSVRLLGEETVAVDDGGSPVDELAVVVACVLAKHLERGRLVDAVALHQDPLGEIGPRTAPERALEVVVFGEAAHEDQNCST
jgi:hypothetical protein